MHMLIQHQYIPRAVSTYLVYEASIDALEIAITIEYHTQVIRMRDRLIETLRDRLIETTGLLEHREVTTT